MDAKAFSKAALHLLYTHEHGWMIWGAFKPTSAHRFCCCPTLASDIVLSSHGRIFVNSALNIEQQPDLYFWHA